MNGAYRDDDEARGAMLESLERENEDLQAELASVRAENRRLKVIAKAIVRGEPVRVIDVEREVEDLKRRFEATLDTIRPLHLVLGLVALMLAASTLWFTTLAR